MQNTELGVKCSRKDKSLSSSLTYGRVIGNNIQVANQAC